MWKRIHECIAELMNIEEESSPNMWELLVSRLLSKHSCAQENNNAIQ
jgi:hypothetical protein